MKNHCQQARASENFAGPVDFETPRPDLPVRFLNFQKLWWCFKIYRPSKISLALACWPWSFISPDDNGMTQVKPIHQTTLLDTTTLDKSITAIARE